MQTETRSLSDKLWLILKGLAMGAANKVPGVSGGVVAFVAGFYEEFIYSLQRVNGTALKLLFGGRLRSFWKYINGKFLGLLILGMLISYFSISLLLDLAIRNYPLLVWSAFFGMIIGSIYYIGKDFEKWKRQTITMLISGIVAGVAISLMEPAQENDNLFFVFICGIIGVSGMTLPGLSGSFILILLGNYVLLLVDSVNALFQTITKSFAGNFSYLEDPEHMRLLTVLIVFSAGSLVGLVTLSHFLSFLLKKFRAATNAAILGFIIGSLGVVWPWKREVFKLNTAGERAVDRNGDFILDNYDRFLPSNLNVENVLAVFFILAGIFMVVALGKYGEKTRSNARR